MDTRISLLFSHLAYRNKSDLDSLNLDHAISWDEKWNNLYGSMKHLVENTTVQLYDCSDYGVGDAQFIWGRLSNNTLIIGFRGTESLSDAFIDMRFRKDKCIDVSYHPLYLKLKKDMGFKASYVHRGFYRQYNSIKYKISEIITEYLNENPSDPKIIFCGHSLGGALSMIATLTAKIHYSKKKPTIQNVTFGCPRVGNRWFMKVYNYMVKSNAFHYFHQNDIVSHYPKIGYRIINKNHVKVNEKRPWYNHLWRLKYHRLDNYLNYDLKYEYFMED